MPAPRPSTLRDEFFLASIARLTIADLSDRFDRVISAMVALAANAVIVGFLLFALRTIETETPEESNAIQIIWIQDERPTSAPDTAVGRASFTTRARPPSAHPARSRSAATSSRALPTIEIPAAAQAPTLVDRTTDDGWDKPMNETSSRANAGDVAFIEPNPLVRKPRPMQASVDRMILVFQDNSLGGRLQRMSKGAACRELAAALRSSPASASSILASMDHYGCNKP